MTYRRAYTPSLYVTDLIAPITVRGYVSGEMDEWVLLVTPRGGRMVAYEGVHLPEAADHVDPAWVLWVVPTEVPTDIDPSGDGPWADAVPGSDALLVSKATVEKIVAAIETSDLIDR